MTQVRAWGLAVLLIASPARAQVVSTVPASSDVYRRVESVSAIFPVPVHLGLRPASVRSVRAILDRLDAAVQAAPASHPRRSWALEEIGRLRQALGDPGTGTRGAWSAETFGSNALAARIDSNGLGTLDAVEHPFAVRRRGLPSPVGAAITLQPVLSLQARRLGVVAAPRATLSRARRSESELTIGRTYARGVAGTVALQVGADEIHWGQSPNGSLFLSEHAAGAPAITVSTDAPIRLPWWFGIAGPMQAALVVADLGGEQNPPHARLAGWHVAMHPWSRFELGVSVLVHTGGNGGPRATFAERVIDLFPVIDALAPQRADLQISNKVAGGNLRLRFPEWSGLDVYYELAIDDFDGRRLVSSFVDDAGHLLGARVAVGPAVVRGEVHRTALRLYEHGQFKSGLTYRERLFGSPLGPNAKAVHLGAEWDVEPGLFVALNLSDQRRDPSLYTVPASPFDEEFRFVRVTDDPDVRHSRALLVIERSVGQGGLHAAIGYNRARPGAGDARHEWMAQLGLRSRFLPGF